MGLACSAAAEVGIPQNLLDPAPLVGNPAAHFFYSIDRDPVYDLCCELSVTHRATTTERTALSARFPRPLLPPSLIPRPIIIANSIPAVLTKLQLQAVRFYVFPRPSFPSVHPQTLCVLHCFLCFLFLMMIIFLINVLFPVTFLQIIMS
jgi:hypothetical protein